ncbi:MAG TPA: hypothetical protein VKX28_29355 [Xanthobacteraceae bacterium]|nr:hypothetical protein [Xanthobacteraceae bacterium]
MGMLDDLVALERDPKRNRLTLTGSGDQRRNVSDNWSMITGLAGA